MKNSQVINQLAKLLACESSDSENYLKYNRESHKFIRELQQEIDRLNQTRSWEDSNYRHTCAVKQEELSHLHEVYGKVCEAAVLVLQTGWVSAREGLAAALRDAGYEPFPRVSPVEWGVDTPVQHLPENGGGWDDFSRRDDE